MYIVQHMYCAILYKYALVVVGLACSRKRCFPVTCFLHFTSISHLKYEQMFYGDNSAHVHTCKKWETLTYTWIYKLFQPLGYQHQKGVSQVPMKKITKYITMFLTLLKITSFLMLTKAVC